MGGGEKALLDLGGARLLDRAVARIASQTDRVAISANGALETYRALGLPVLPDTLPGHLGPLAGVLAGMDWAASVGAEAVVSVAADTPFFPLDLVQRLRSEGDLVLAATPDPVRKLNRHPTFGLWPVGLRDDLRAALDGGLRKVVLWTDRHDAGLAMFEATPFDPFFNINTPEDLDRAEGLL